MAGEHGIPLLSSTTLNWVHFSTMLGSHLASVGETRLLDFTYQLPMKEVATRTNNPKWVGGAEATSTSSETSENTGASTAPVMQPPQFYNTYHMESNPMVQSFSPGLDKLGGEKTVPYNLLNQQLISLLARLLDKSLHHLLQIPAGSDPYSVARNVYRNVRKHFQGQEWINKDVLTQKWNAIVDCVTPEATYNELLRVNDQCSSAGVGHTPEQMATKFDHLLQTHHPTAYIGLFSDLASAGECATIQGLWHTAQITANALEKNTAKFPPTHSFGLQAHQQASQQAHQLFATQNRPIFRNPPPHAQPPTKRLRTNAPPCNWC